MTSDIIPPLSPESYTQQFYVRVLFKVVEVSYQDIKRPVLFQSQSSLVLITLLTSQYKVRHQMGPASAHWLHVIPRRLATFLHGSVHEPAAVEAVAKARFQDAMYVLMMCHFLFLNSFLSGSVIVSNHEAMSMNSIAKVLTPATVLGCRPR